MQCIAGLTWSYRLLPSSVLLLNDCFRKTDKNQKLLFNSTCQPNLFFFCLFKIVSFHERLVIFFKSICLIRQYMGREVSNDVFRSTTKIRVPTCKDRAGGSVSKICVQIFKHFYMQFHKVPWLLFISRVRIGSKITNEFFLQNYFFSKRSFSPKELSVTQTGSLL